MYKVTCVNYKGISSTHCVSLRDAVRTVENPYFTGRIRVLNGVFTGYVIEKGYLTHFLNMLLN